MMNTVPMRETHDHANARVITLDEAAEMLCCLYSTVLRLVTGGELRAFRVRGAWRTSFGGGDEYWGQAPLLIAGDFWREARWRYPNE